MNGDAVGVSGEAVNREVEAAKPQLGFTVPAWSLRALFAVVAIALCAALAGSELWLVVSLALALAAVVVPRWMTAWFLIGVLVLASLLHGQALTDWRTYTLIAGAHALHLLASWMLVVAPGARLQPAALWPSTRRFLLIQIPVQLVAVGALALATTASAGFAWLAVVGGLAIAGVVALLAGPLLSGPRN
ncbi:hypothetical protein [Leifsonia poae]|uniref:hypothetical protein n=1 Tax=Leifsonia poae TaxID=110933 RepID=UPI001CBACC1E|nr:hypothetical protein [Leifsonia poae]